MTSAILPCSLPRACLRDMPHFPTLPPKERWNIVMKRETVGPNPKVSAMETNIERTSFIGGSNSLKKKKLPKIRQHPADNWRPTQTKMEKLGWFMKLRIRFGVSARWVSARRENNAAFTAARAAADILNITATAEHLKFRPESLWRSTGRREFVVDM